MVEYHTKITPMDPVFHGESNYEVGLEGLLKEQRELISKLESQSQPNKETLHLAKEELQALETLWENYHIGMNVFRNAKGGRDGVREVKTD